MTQVHAIGHALVLAAAVGYVVLGVGIAVLEKAPRQAHLASVALLAGIITTGVAGVISALSGSGPSEGIHWVYGVVMVVGVLGGIGSGTTMAPRPRGLTMVATGTLLLLLAFRLAETG